MISPIFISEDDSGFNVNLVAKDGKGMFVSSKVVKLKTFDKASVLEAIEDYQAELDEKVSAQAQLDTFVADK